MADKPKRKEAAIRGAERRVLLMAMRLFRCWEKYPWADCYDQRMNLHTACRTLTKRTKYSNG